MSKRDFATERTRETGFRNKKIGLWIALVITAVFLWTVFQGSAQRVEARILIQAPDGLIYTQLNELENWRAWFPWWKADRGVRLIPGDTLVGKGAKLSWESALTEPEFGEVHILNSLQNTSLSARILLGKDAVGPQLSAFWQIEEGPEGHWVNWSIVIPMGNPASKLMKGKVKDELQDLMDQGLQDLKAICEKVSGV